MVVLDSYDACLVAARALLADHGDRHLLGVAGVPGAGKTTLAQRLVADLARTHPGWVAHVPMDGFHLADATLERHGTRAAKGAVETFDGWGYLHLLRRLREDREHPILAPTFERTLEQPIAGAIEVGPEVRLVISEGNYLLLDQAPWPQVAEVFDEVWFCEADDDARVAQLIDRHVRFGKSPAQARAWVEEVDEVNAALVRAGRAAADRVVTTF